MSKVKSNKCQALIIHSQDASENLVKFNQLCWYRKHESSGSEINYYHVWSDSRTNKLYVNNMIIKTYYVYWLNKVHFYGVDYYLVVYQGLHIVRFRHLKSELLHAVTPPPCWVWLKIYSWLQLWHCYFFSVIFRL